jgi:hypothetical protein
MMCINTYSLVKTVCVEHVLQPISENVSSPEFTGIIIVIIVTIIIPVFVPYCTNPLYQFLHRLVQKLK